MANPCLDKPRHGHDAAIHRFNRAADSPRQFQRAGRVTVQQYRMHLDVEFFSRDGRDVAVFEKLLHALQYGIAVLDDRTGDLA